MAQCPPGCDGQGIKEGTGRSRGPKDHIKTTISPSGSKGQYKEDARNTVLQDLYADVVFWGAKESYRASLSLGRKTLCYK